jgi:hypothetical protein
MSIPLRILSNIMSRGTGAPALITYQGIVVDLNRHRYAHFGSWFGLHLRLYLVDGLYVYVHMVFAWELSFNVFPTFSRTHVTDKFGVIVHMFAQIRDDHKYNQY